MPAMNRIPNLRFLSYICTLNVVSQIELWKMVYENFDGQGCSLSFGAGFKQMEASCVFWKLKASRRVSLMCLKPWNTLRRTSFMCILGLWKLSEEQTSWVLWELKKLSEHISCVYQNFQSSHKNKLHVCSKTLKLLLSQKTVKASSAS